MNRLFASTVLSCHVFIDFPKRDHRRPPAFFILRLGARPLGFIDFGDFGDLSGSWSTLGASSGTLGGLLGALGGVLGPLRMLLGESWGLSGRLRRDQNNMLKEERFQERILGTVLVFDPLMESQDRSKSDPKRVHIQDEFQERKSCSSRASWARLGSILKHFGSHLGIPICAPVLAGVISGENSRF